MFYSTYAYGHDFGNAETGGVTWIRDQEYAQCLPSALYAGTYEELIQKVSGSSSSSSLMNIVNQKAHTIRLEAHDGHMIDWYVGNLAIEQAPPNMDIRDLTGRGDISRYWSARSLALLLSTSASLIRDTEYGLAVVTNLPISTHNEANVKKVRDALTGDHTFWLDGIKRIAHVRVMKTIMEGAGANIAFGPGGTEKVAVVDIGGRTVNGYMVKGQLPLTEQCKSLDTGVESAIDAIVQEFEKVFSYPLSLSDGRALLHAYSHGKRYETVATVLNAEADPRAVGLLIEQQLRKTGQIIADFIRRSWASSLSSDVVASDVGKILAIGGGAYYFEDDLRKLFKKRLTVPESPEFANSIGYAKLAKHYLLRETTARQQIG